MKATETDMRKNPLYSTLRSGFKVLPRPLKTTILGAFNSTVWNLRGELQSVQGRFKPFWESLKLRAVSSVGKFYCSVCDRRVNHFNPLPPEFMESPRKYGYEYSLADAETCNAENYSCPHCGTSDRERLYALYLQDYLHKVKPNGRLIDFAPSPAFSSFIRKLLNKNPRNVSYRTADLLRPTADDNVDIMDMKIYGDSSVDFFICSHILEHVTDDKQALKELYRILKVGGRGILVVPIVLAANEIDEDPSVTDTAERWRRFGQDDHVRLYSKEGFLSRARQAGFVVHQFGSDHFPKGSFEKHGITPQSVLYIAEKV